MWPERQGADTELIATKPGKVQAVNHLDKADTFRPDDNDALVLPGAVMNPAQLRMDKAAIAFIQGFYQAGRPIAAICHGPWTLAEAVVVNGKRRWHLGRRGGPRG